MSVWFRIEHGFELETIGLMTLKILRGFILLAAFINLNISVQQSYTIPNFPTSYLFMSILLLIHNRIVTLDLSGTKSIYYLPTEYIKCLRY